jgi:hypothetical protein
MLTAAHQIEAPVRFQLLTCKNLRAIGAADYIMPARGAALGGSQR